MILPAAYAREAINVLQWELFLYDSQFSTFLPQMSPWNIICVKGKWKELSSITKFISNFKPAAKFGIFNSIPVVFAVLQLLTARMAH